MYSKYNMKFGQNVLNILYLDAWYGGESGDDVQDQRRLGVLQMEVLHVQEVVTRLYSKLHYNYFLDIIVHNRVSSPFFWLP